MFSKALRFGRASKDEPPSPVPEYNRLWKCNEPPSEGEKAAILLRIRKLKSSLRKISSKSGVNPAALEDLEIDIQQHRNLLSSVRYIPPETWGLIFELSLRHTNAGAYRLKNRYDIILQRLCSVCSYWRAILKGNRRLWTSLPVVIFEDRTANAIPPSLYRAVERRLELYLTLSHPLPLALHYTFCARDTKLDNRSTPIRVLDRLMKESHRWYTVTLTVPLELMERLSRVRRRTNMLRKLTLAIHPPAGPTLDTNVSLSAFSVAPSLRHLILNPRYNADAGPLVVQDVLPWGQLETYASNANVDVMYELVLQTSEGRLSSVTCTAHTLKWTSPQSNFLRLPFLRKLHLRVGAFMYDGPDQMPGNVVFNHLTQLTLPALEDLEVREDQLDADDDLYRAAIQLTRRSGCSLKRLALDEKVPFDIQSDPFYGGRLELWPNLTHLDIRCPSGDEIAILDPRALGGTSFILPKLQVLILRRNALEGRYPDENSVMNPTAFLKMLRSRGWDTHTDPRAKSGKRCPASPLREVRIIYSEDPFSKGHRWAQLEAFEASREVPFGDADIDPHLAETYARLLSNLFCASCASPHFDDFIRTDMSSLMRRLEQVDLRRLCSRVLVRRGVVHLLHQANFKADGSIPGDKTFQFRQRAKNLCNAWKPHLLRDHRASSYRLCYSGSHSSATLRIKYVPTGSYHDTDEDAWNEILGLDINYNELLSPVGR